MSPVLFLSVIVKISSGSKTAQRAVSLLVLIKNRRSWEKSFMTFVPAFFLIHIGLLNCDRIFRFKLLVGCQALDSCFSCSSPLVSKVSAIPTHGSIHKKEILLDKSSKSQRKAYYYSSMSHCEEIFHCGSKMNSTLSFHKSRHRS